MVFRKKRFYDELEIFEQGLNGFKKVDNFFEKLQLNHVSKNDLQKVSLDDVVCFGLRSFNLEPAFGKSNHIVERLSYFLDSKSERVSDNINYDSLLTLTRSFYEGPFILGGLRRKLKFLEQGDYFFRKDKAISVKKQGLPEPRSLNLENSSKSSVYLLSKEDLTYVNELLKK